MKELCLWLINLNHLHAHTKTHTHNQGIYNLTTTTTAKNLKMVVVYSCVLVVKLSYKKQIEIVVVKLEKMDG